MRYNWIYDTPALVGHVNGESTRVRAGLQLSLEEPSFRLTVPATCLLEAYQHTNSDLHHLLDSLATSPAVAITPVGEDPGTVVAIGELVGETGRAGAAHAAHVATTGEGPSLVFTDAPMPADALSRPI